MTLAAPFPYFGGKRRAAPAIWRALGDPSGYVEPFAGSAAVLLARPEFKGRRVETINDADGYLELRFQKPSFLVNQIGILKNFRIRTGN